MNFHASIQSISIGTKAFIFGGAYGNLQATEAILQKASELGFSKSEIIFTGDMIAYCANPNETTSLIKEHVDHIIMGNCEEAIANNSNNCGCGFEEGSECSILSRQWYEYCLSQIDQQTAIWMGSLPKKLIARIGDHQFLVTHAVSNSINQFVFPSNLQNQHDTEPVDGYIIGHSGIPFIGSVNDKPWINSGASGMPANDGSSNIWYATIHCTEDNITCETQSLGYSVQSAKIAMQEASLANGYMECLSSGIWPSHDVLPEHERQQTGVKLQPQKKAFQRTPLRKTILI